eukprot:TRINITY_DN10792_c0_g1_i2.p1 TRINITY_DN10792_c0_g1~~TRINITY_DN10792_c0_g1_i2.p1  ORF type:complete len:354 (+),score=63.87 TRINITY_DN10792_c0_g1_i2:72-1133(+)
MVVASVPSRLLDGLDKQSSRIVFGCLFLHNTDNPYDLLDEAWKRGVNTFDCAAIYGGGQCEVILGNWIAERGHQDSAIIITKGGCGGQDSLWAPKLDEASVRKDLNESLKRLRLSVIDVYMLHRDDPSVTAGSIVKMMNTIMSEGSFRSWAVSNWSPQRIQQAIEFADENNLSPPNCSSIQLSLAQPSHEVWPGTEYMRGYSCANFYKTHKIPVLAWECLAKGFLVKDPSIHDKELIRSRTESHKELSPENGDEWREYKLRSAYVTPENIARCRRTRQLADQLGVSPAVVALAWILSQQYSTFALVGTTKRSHLLQALEAASVKLTPSQCSWLSSGIAEEGSTEESDESHEME